MLNMHQNELYDLYLGLPAFSRRNKQRLFEGIKEKVWQKLQGWKSQMFSIGGREILIEAVAQAIPSYTMSIFRLPLALCDRLRAMITNFWWVLLEMRREYIRGSGVCCVNQKFKGVRDLGISAFLTKRY